MQIVVTRLSLWDFDHRDARVSRHFCHANLQMLDCIISLPSSAYEIKCINTYYMNELPPVRIRTLPPAVVVSQRPSKLYTQPKYDLFSSLEAYTRARAKIFFEATLNMLMHILEFFEGDLCTEPAWKVKFAHLVPLHTVSTYSSNVFMQK